MKKSKFCFVCYPELIKDAVLRICKSCNEKNKKKFEQIYSVCLID